MRLVALSDGIARLEQDGSVSRLDVPAPGLTSYLRSGGHLADLGRAAVSSTSPMADAPIAPVAGPGATVWGIGLNYRSKLDATGRERPEHPVLFVKAPGAVCTDRVHIGLPAASDSVDYEAEVAVLVAQPLFEASPSDARVAVGGVAAANDVTARDVMRWSGHPTLAKSFPGFGQLGAVVDVGIDVVSSPIRIASSVNGIERQSDDTSGMLIPVDELLSLISRYTPLWPGDVVLTGTPAGTGDEERRYLSAGDVVEVAVGDLPILRSWVGTTSIGRAHPRT